MTGSRALRLLLVLVAVVAAGVLATSAVATSTTETSVTSLNRQVLAAVNAFRVAHHLAPLGISRGLNASAREHSMQMGVDGYFAHPSADGTAFWRRIERYWGSSGFRYWSVGENLLWAAPDVSASHAMAMWIASPEHLANLLTARWRRIGISAVHVTGAPGVYGGLDVTIITTDFGVRR